MFANPKVLFIAIELFPMFGLEFRFSLFKDFLGKIISSVESSFASYLLEELYPISIGDLSPLSVVSNNVFSRFNIRFEEDLKTE